MILSFHVYSLILSAQIPVIIEEGIPKITDPSEAGLGGFSKTGSLGSQLVSCFCRQPPFS